MLPIITSVTPNILLWLLLLLALYLWWATRGNRRARGWGAVVLILFWMFSTAPVADNLLRSLEDRYTAPAISSLRAQGVQQVVVLTGGGFPVRGDLLSSAFPQASIYRFIGGLELSSRLGPNCRLIFSGASGRAHREVQTALTMKDLASLIGPHGPILAEARSGSTAEHPGNVRPLLEKGPFVLVTSAYHMPRSMRTFWRAGLNPIAYPDDFFALRHYSWMDVLPSEVNLRKMNIALREYMALVLYTIKGW